MSNTFEQSVPECFFNMKQLKYLSLAGMGLHGKIPDIKSISSQLQNLVLSHNHFSGTIPKLIQKQRWQYLDLSYNRIGGDLIADSPPMYDNQSLNLNGNTLSGKVPVALQAAANIKILKENGFGNT